MDGILVMAILAIWIILTATFCCSANSEDSLAIFSIMVFFGVVICMICIAILASSNKGTEIGQKGKTPATSECQNPLPHSENKVEQPFFTGEVRTREGVIVFEDGNIVSVKTNE